MRTSYKVHHVGSRLPPQYILIIKGAKHAHTDPHDPVYYYYISPYQYAKLEINLIAGLLDITGNVKGF